MIPEMTPEQVSAALQSLPAPAAPESGKLDWVTAINAARQRFESHPSWKYADGNPLSNDALTIAAELMVQVAREVGEVNAATVATLTAQLAEVQAENNSIRIAWLEAKDCFVELNLGNYNDCDVSRAQDGWMTAYDIMEAALAEYAAHVSKVKP